MSPRPQNPTWDYVSIRLALSKLKDVFLLRNDVTSIFMRHLHIVGIPRYDLAGNSTLVIGPL